MTSMLDKPHWQEQIRLLHVKASRDTRHWQEQREEDARLGKDNNDLVRMGLIYLAISEEDGQLLYQMARDAGAIYIVEFGASYGVSTLYLGAAACDNGGRMFTTEVHPDKCQAIRRTLAGAGLEETVALLEGDARETLASLEDGIDFLFLDGWKSQYLPILELLTPRLVPGALVVADNVNHPAGRDYLQRITTSSTWSTDLSGELAVSRYLA